MSALQTPEEVFLVNFAQIDHATVNAILLERTHAVVDLLVNEVLDGENRENIVITLLYQARSNLEMMDKLIHYRNPEQKSAAANS